MEYFQSVWQSLLKFNDIEVITQELALLLTR